MPEILKASNDLIFKRVFGDARNKDILAGFLKSVLDFPEDEYEELSILNPHTTIDKFKDKTAILDVLVHTKSKEIVHVEIQMLRGRSEAIEKAVGVLEFLSQDEQAKAEYEAREKALKDYNSGMFSARQEGLLEGREEGAKKKAIETARKFLKMGLTVEEVAKGTDLTLEEVHNLN